MSRTCVPILVSELTFDTIELWHSTGQFPTYFSLVKEASL